MTAKEKRELVKNIKRISEAMKGKKAKFDFCDLVLDVLAEIKDEQN